MGLFTQNIKFTKLHFCKKKSVLKMRAIEKSSHAQLSYIVQSAE